MDNEVQLHEFFEKVAKIKTAVKKKEFLIENESRQLRTFLKGAFDKSLEFNLPKGTPPYTPNKVSIDTLLKDMKVMLYKQTLGNLGSSKFWRKYLQKKQNYYY